jgi:hypothetical protein
MRFHSVGRGMTGQTQSATQMFDSARSAKAAKDGELDCHYETEFHE